MANDDNDLEALTMIDEPQRAQIGAPPDVSLLQRATPEEREEYWQAILASQIEAFKKLGTPNPEETAKALISEMKKILA